MKQKVEIEVDVPEGWKAVAYRTPREDEWYLQQHGPARAPCNLAHPWLILRRVEPKRETRWFPALPFTYDTGFKSAEELKATHKFNVEKTYRIDYENGQPVAVYLEPLSEEGAP